MEVRKFAFSVVFVVGCLALLEVLARLLIPAPGTGILANRPITALYPGVEAPERIFAEVTAQSLQWAPYEHYVMKPNLEGRFFRTNSLGLRGPEVELPKPAGRFRIVVLGGSAAWGYGATSDRNTVAGRLERYLAERRPDWDVEVLNAGQSGFVSAQELIFFHRVVAPLEPDLVVLFDAYNDAVADLLNPSSGWPQNAQLLRSRYESSFGRWPSTPDLVSLLRTSRLLDAAARRIGRSAGARVRPVVSPSETASTYLRNAAAIARLAAPAPVWIAPQPALANVSKPLAPEEKRMLAEKEAAVPGYRERIRETYRRIATGAADGGFRFIDLSGALDSERALLFADECHFGDRAAALVAAEIGRRLTIDCEIVTAPERRR